ncbi:MAG TPA: carboxyl transferase [Candidatus Faecimorpha stercoravium]|nr:carboxyl transferase [Candidatus Faecimorpha stercoravium]
MDKIQELKASRSAVESGAKAARGRIASLLDPQSFVEIGAYVKSRSTDYNMQKKDTPADGVVTGYGTIEDRLVYVYSQDASVLGGAVGEMHAAKIVALYRKAVEMGAPVIGIIDSQGLRLQELTDALAGYGKIYAAQAQASGVVPQITVVAGTAAGGAAVIPGLSDFTFMIDKQSKVFVSSANAMEKGTDFDAIAAASVHGAKTGLADFVCADEAECFAKVRALVDMLPANNGEDAPIYENLDDLNRVSDVLNAVVPEDGSGFDVRGVLAELADASQFMEVKAEYAKSMVVGFMRLNGGTVGVVANNSAEEQGVLTVGACRKAAQFVRFCDAFELPILTVTDTVGFVASKDEENAGLAQAAAELTSAFAQATVAKVNLITGKAYGSAAMVMNSKETGADVVLAWPSAEVAVMNAQSAARILYAEELNNGADLAEKTEEVAELSTPYAAAARGSVDDIIEPAQTRKHLLVAFGMLAGKQQLSPAKKHSAR